MVKNGPWVRKIPWRREWLPTPVFLPGEFHGQRSLAGYGVAELDTTEKLKLLFSLWLKSMENYSNSILVKMLFV